jgi:hypothetical protein
MARERIDGFVFKRSISNLEEAPFVGPDDAPVRAPVVMLNAGFPSSLSLG